MRLALVLLVATSVAPAIAADGDRDCYKATTQVELTACAGRELDAADARLNATYREALALAREADAEGSRGSAAPIVSLLRDAQRAWIPFRDRACDFEATSWGGGTGQSMAYLQCKTRLTLARTQDLRTYIDFPN